MMKRFLSTTLCALFLLPVMAACASFNIDSVAESVVRVAFIYEEEYWQSHGSGFIIGHAGGSTYIVTNRHVVMDYGSWEYDSYDDEWYFFQTPYSLQKTHMYVMLDDVNDVRLHVSEIIIPSQGGVDYFNGIDDGMDIAVIKVDTGLSARKVLPLASSYTARRGDKVYAAGFPGTSDSLFGDRGRFPSKPEDVTITTGIISNAEKKYEDSDTKYLQMDAVINPGNSGGPLISENGAVIGVNTIGWGNTATNGAVFIDYIIEQCDRLNIPYTMASDSFLAAYWWILAIAGGVVLILIITIIIVSTRKKPAAQTAGIPAGQYAPQPVYAGGAQPQASRASSHLICSRGHFAGTTFPINNSLSIGRDPQRCQIVFPSDAKGISSLHCELRLQGASIVLMDKGSSYGTFLAGGRKLNANESVALNPGDSFYLADNKNEFKVL